MYKHNLIYNYYNMPITLPPNTTLQFSSDIGDINHQGISSSNINGTEILPTFPTTSTGTSTGNYNHLGIDGQGNNKWDFLNASGTLDGGYNFWHSNNSHAPLLITSIDDIGLTVDRSTSGPPPIESPPIYSLPDGSHIEFASNVDLRLPPYNFIIADLTANPIYMTQGNSTYNIGDLCYAFLTTPSQIQIFGNNATTNPIPPNTIPSGFPTSDTSGFVTGQPVFALSLQSPSVTKTSILTSEGLYIKTDTNFAPAVLSTFGLSIADTSGNSSMVSSTAIAVQDSNSYNTQLTTSGLNINGNAKTVALNETNMTITDTTNNSVLSSTSLILNGNYYNGNPLYNSTITDNNIIIRDDDQGFINTFGSNSININDGAVVSNIETGQISFTNGIDTSVLSIYDLKFDGRSYAQNQVVPTLIYSSPVIYADGVAPATSLSIRATYGYSGWYFQNVSTGNKINWYFPPPTIGVTTVADLKGVAMSYFNGVTTTIGASPFIIVYTVPTGSGDYVPGFYHSSQLYQPPSNPTANTNYQACILANKSTIPFNYETQVQWVAGTTHGTYSQGDKILAVVRCALVW